MGAPLEINIQHAWVGWVKLFTSYFGLALVLVLTAGSGQAANPPPALSGDLVVKFRDNSEAAVLLARTFHANPNRNAPLQTLARQLSAELGVTLSALRVTSGQELVLGIDRAQLARTVKDRLAREPAVQSATVTEHAKTLLPAAELAVSVKLSANSAAARQVQRDRQAGQRTSPGLEKLVTQLCSGVYPQPGGHIDDKGNLILTLDIAELTRDLALRLKRRSDVVYAQPNLIVRPFLKREISPPSSGPQ